MEKITGYSLQKGDFKLLFNEIEHPTSGIVLVSGPSGAGKTSFLRSLAGLDSKQANFEWSVDNSAKGFHFQDMKIFDNLTVLENLTIILNDVTKAKSFLSKLGLSNKSENLAASLSGGELQRLGFLRAFMGEEARLIFLDEPFGQVNLEIREQMYDFLNEYRNKGFLIFVSTHIANELKHDHEIKIS